MNTSVSQKELTYLPFLKSYFENLQLRTYAQLYIRTFEQQLWNYPGYLGFPVNFPVLRKE